VFPKKTLSRSFSEYEVDWGKYFWHGVLDISSAYIVSYLDYFVEGVLHPYFSMQYFSKAFFLHSFIMV
jgi:hypothetical protein